MVMYWCYYSISKRRKLVGDEQEMGNANPSGRDGRGRTRKRACGRAESENLNRKIEHESSMVEQQPPQDSIQMNVSVSSPQEIEKNDGIAASNEDAKQQLQTPKGGIDFDLNAESLDLNETKLAPDTVTAAEEYTCWSKELGKIEPAQFTSLGKRIYEEQEDYKKG